jgi:hypothetical protein
VEYIVKQHGISSCLGVISPGNSVNIVINSTILKHEIVNYIYLYMFMIFTPEFPDMP